eukprot:XP_011662158.1 PREDICTED: fibronectin [Strongylocentrotus purpuratus]
MTENGVLDVASSPVPDHVTTLTSSLTTSTNITLNWNSALGVVSYYEVAYDPPNGNSPRRTDVRADEPRTLTLSGLFPDSQYTVTVVTWSGTGEDATSSTPFSVMFDTAPILPLQVIVRFVNETEAQLTWGLVLGEDTYIITVDDSGANPIPSSETVPEGETPLSVRKGLTPGSLYTANVQTTTATGPDQQFRTSPYPPLDLDVADSTPTSIDVAWAPPRAGGVFDEYILSYSIGDRIRTEVGRFAPDVTTATINNLNTATTYNIYLVTEANDGGFPQSSDVITREGRTEIPAPGEIVIINRTPTSFRFQWGPSIVPDVTYITTYSPSDGSKLDTLSIRQSDVTGAIPGRLYELTVFVLPGDQQETGLVRTLPSSPGLLAVTAVDYVSVTLTWVPGTGEYTGFIISYKPTEGITYMDVEEVDQDVRTWKVEGLSPDVSYDFQVVAVSGEHNTTYSEPTRRINTTTLSIAADAFVVLDYNSTSITVAWRDTNTNIIVNIEPQDDEARNVNVGDRPVHTFTGLNPSTTYTITSLSQSQNLVTQVRTNPASPSNLEVSKTSTSFSIEWEAAESEVSQYKVDVKCADMSCSFNDVIYPNERLVYELEGLVYLKEYLVTVSSCLDMDGQFAEQMGDEPLESSIITDDVPDDEIVVQETTTDNITIFYATGNRRGFVEAIYLAGTPAQVGSNSFVTGAVVKKTFDGLVPGTLYTIRITELTNTIIPRTVNVRTRPIAPSAIFGSPTSTVIPIFWFASPGSISFYEVTYSPPDGTTPAVSRIDASGPLSLDIVTLLPQKVYTVFVRAVTGVDNMPSISKAVSGMFETLPAQPGEIILRRITTDTITYTLSEVPSVLQYIVQLNIGTDLQSANPHVLPNVEGEFDELTPGQLYTLVLTVPGTQGDLATIQVRTDPNPPGSVSVELTSVPYSSLLAEWEAPPAGSLSGYEVSVRPADQVLTTMSEVVDSSTTELLLDNLLPEVNYTVEVRTISAGEGFSSTSDPTEALGRTAPFPEAILLVTGYDSTTISVTWRKKEGVDYLAQFIEVGQEIGEDFQGLVQSSSSTTTILSFRYTDLVPGRNYELIVRSNDQSEDTIRVSQRTLPSPPMNAAAAPLSAESIRVTWTAATNDFEFYEVTFYPSADSTDSTAMTIPRDQFSVDIDSLLADTEYVFDIRSVSGSGDSLQKSAAITASATTEPIIMRLFSAVENVLLIDFTPIVGIFDDYRYGYRALPSGTITYEPLDSGTSQFGIQGLRSGALYEITLDTRIGSIYTEVDRIQARTRPSAPRLISPVTDFDENSFTLEWLAPSTAEVDFDGFRVIYTPADGALESPLLLDKTRTSLFLTRLEPGTEYMVTLVSVSGQGSTQQVSFEEDVSVTTADGVPGGVNIKELTETSIRITWNSALGATYIPTITPDEGTTRILDTEAAIFEELTPGQLYTLIMTQIGGSSGPPTQQYTLPNAPMDVAISRTTAFELDVSWSPPAEGFYNSFSLTYSRVGTSEVTTIPVPASDAPSVTLPDLLPETSYAVSVVSVVGTINSQPAETSGTTGRAPEGVPVLVERTTTTISISWGASTDALATGYQLRIRPEGGTSILFNLGQAITTYNFMNLESGTNYIISLQIFGLSEAPQELPVTTYPQTPGAIQILRTTQTSITFAWGSAGGNFDRYSINLYPDGSQTAFLQDVPRGSDLTVSKNYLAPGTLYRIEIYAVTGTTRSALRETTASTAMELLVFITIDAFGVAVSWPNAPDFSNYYLEYDPSNGVPPSPVPTTQDSVFLNSLTPGQIYNFALSSGTPDTGTQSLVRATYVLAPLAPTIEIMILSPTTILIKILPASSGVLDYYRVGVTARQTGLGVGQNGVASFNIPREACPEVFITDLVPGGTYDVEVVAVSGETDSAVSSMDVSLETMVAGQLYVNDRTTTSLEVVWGAVTDRTFTNYVLNLFLGNTRTDFQSQGINEERKVLFEGLLPGTEYSLNLLVEGDAITQSTILTATAPLTPGSLSFLTVEGQEVTLAWPARNSQVDSYELCWTPSSQTRSPTADATQELLTLEQSDVEYTISLYALVSVGVGDDVKTTRSDAITRFITLSEALEGELNVTDFDSNSISVEWSEVVSIEFENYRLQATPEGDGSPIFAVIPPEDPRMHTFENLIPGVRYTVNNILQGSDPVVTRTVSQRTRPNPVSGLTVVDTTSQSVTVNWQQATGSFNDYVVTYTLADEPTTVIYADRIPSDGTRVSVIDGLLPDTSYVVTVYTSSGTDADETTSTEESVPATTTALPSCSIQVTETTYTEITVQWGSCAVVVNSYELTIEPNSANAPPGNVPIGGNFEYTFNSLVPGQRYIVGIRGTGSTEPYATDSVYTG